MPLVLFLVFALLFSLLLGNSSVSKDQKVRRYLGDHPPRMHIEEFLLFHETYFEYAYGENKHEYPALDSMVTTQTEIFNMGYLPSPYDSMSSFLESKRTSRLDKPIFLQRIDINVLEILANKKLDYPGSKWKNNPEYIYTNEMFQWWAICFRHSFYSAVEEDGPCGSLDRYSSDKRFRDNAAKWDSYCIQMEERFENLYQKYKKYYESKLLEYGVMPENMSSLEKKPEPKYPKF